MTQRNTKTGQFIAKAIADSVANAKQTPSYAPSGTSILAGQNMNQSLSPKQAYELSIPVRSNIQTIATTAGKCAVRLLSRATGEEIVSGPLYNLVKRPNRFQTTSTFLEELISWYEITGEFFISLALDALKNVGGMVPLDPYAMVALPDGVWQPEMLQGWRYSYGGVMIEYSSASIIHCKNFNPYSRLRGLSPLLTSVNEVSSNYFTQRYNKQFFENGTVGDLVFRFPAKTKKETARDFIERWTKQHSIYYDGGFRIAALIGEEIQIEQLNQSPRDGQFLEMSALNTELIDRLYKVPAVEAGNYGKTRFDTVDTERRVYAEHKLMPLLNRLSETLQIGLVDRYFRSASQTKKRPSKLSTLTKGIFAQARDEYTESDIIILLDPDSMPIMSEIKTSQLKVADQYRQSFDTTANEAAQYFGFDLEERPERDQIWVPSTRQRIDAPKTQEPKPVTTPPTSVPLAQPMEPVEPPDMGGDMADGSSKHALTEFARAYRSIVLESIAKEGKVAKAGLLTLAKAHSVPAKAIVQVHADYLILKGMKTTEDAKAYIKETWSKSSIKRLLEK